MAVALAMVALGLVMRAVLLGVGSKSATVASSAHGLGEVVTGAAIGALSGCVDFHSVGIRGGGRSCGVGRALAESGNLSGSGAHGEFVADDAGAEFFQSVGFPLVGEGVDVEPHEVVGGEFVLEADHGVLN